METILASVLEQLLRQNDHIPEPVLALYRNHDKAGTTPVVEEYMLAIEESMRLFQAVFLVVDALDECSERPDARAKLTKGILDIQMRTNCQLLCTSRQNREIVNLFDESDTVLVRAHPDDVQIYLQSRIDDLPTLIRGDVSLRASIIARIDEVNDGM